jgi:hypothetical protein
MDQGAATVLAALITSSAAIVVALVTSRRKHRVVAQPAEPHQSNRPPWGWAHWLAMTSLILAIADITALSALFPGENIAADEIQDAPFLGWR